MPQSESIRAGSQAIFPSVRTISRRLGCRASHQCFTSRVTHGEARAAGDASRMKYSESSNARSIAGQRAESTARFVWSKKMRQERSAYHRKQPSSACVPERCCERSATSSVAQGNCRTHLSHGSVTTPRCAVPSRGSSSTPSSAGTPCCQVAPSRRPQANAARDDARSEQLCAVRDFSRPGASRLSLSPLG